MTAAHATVARFGNELDAVSCPAETECVAIDGNDAYRFDPTAPGRPAAHAVDRDDLNDIACPSVTQCTAVDDAGDADTFDPASRRRARRVRVDRGTFALAVACPSSTQCTAIGGNGDEATFDPTAPGTPTSVPIDPGADAVGIACPSMSQCTLVGDAGEEITFDPASPGAATSEELTGGRSLTAVSCPSSTQCTATGVSDEVTFDPAAPAGPPPSTVARSGELEAVACPSATSCTAVGLVRRDRLDRPSFLELGLDPESPGTAAPALLAGDLPSPSVADVACPSALQCTAVFNGESVTFDPAAPGTIAPTLTVREVGRTRVEITCAGASACAGRLSLRGRAGVLATGRYRVPPGRRRTLRLALRHPVHRRRRATLTITVSGGVTVRRVITVS